MLIVLLIGCWIIPLHCITWPASASYVVWDKDSARHTQWLYYRQWMNSRKVRDWYWTNTVAGGWLESAKPWLYRVWQKPLSSDAFCGLRNIKLVDHTADDDWSDLAARAGLKHTLYTTCRNTNNKKYSWMFNGTSHQRHCSASIVAAVLHHYWQ